MGAGKSTVGPLLARVLGWRFEDIDATIEAREGKAVAEIFAQQGEGAFRAIEAGTIQELAERDDLVLALGGGALESASTRAFLASSTNTCIVFLDAPLDILLARCLAQPSAAERPVLADRVGLSGRLNSRLPHYRQAHLTIATAGLTPEAVVTQVLNAVEAACGADTSTKKVIL
jgi:shikimate kinase